MAFKRTIHAVDTHAGTPMRVVTGGIPHIPGNSVYDKMKWLETNDDQLRKLLLREPRGYPAHCCNIIVPPTHAEADAGYIILEQIEYPVMSGGNTISVVTVLLEMGMLPMKEPVTELVLEAPAGLIRIRAQCENGKVKSVTFKNVPAFAAHLDAVIDVPQLGKVTVDVGWGGMFYVIADVRQFRGLELIPEHGREIARVSSMIRQAAIEQLPVVHPDYPGVGITISQLSGPTDDPRADWKNTVTMASGDFSWDNPATWTGALDRCPCGTGTCAKMAVLHAKGELPLNQDFRHQGILGNIYTGRLVDEAIIGGNPAVVPTLTGTSWIYGLNTIVLDNDDPFTEGFTVGDTWA
ncbi:MULTISPECIES: proline racemase family protein [unclassified Sinorhizobium]|uniref:proline racemase family protein n=1 Tax=unclassified Sinorhizobium TaxID=2613772 RepID=UPI0024C39303|nr:MULTISPECIES: proline racemase family protein [unclassified Sinorhizobium]MDK1374169.1 proline racemase family protein [Sinorhizobium sp. 6-70]MDK1477910.1 proline racemase family protein [Sinorhizobium sp. 6-117]